ncbi:DEAD/DEAH box helicase [bacterium]|nr:DEAD/DEAH box helicase [bacterium]
MTLRPYQQSLKQDIQHSWREGHRNTLAVLPTGSGKTVLFSDILREHDGPSCAIAHRQELVSQISMALARDGVRHQIIGPKNVVRLVVQLHMFELGQSWYDASAPCAVAGVDTLVRRSDQFPFWLNSVSLLVQDEAHHILKKNKWGTAAGLFPKARMLGVTATPLRADGKGLGRHADGLFDNMVVGPSMRELINQGYLTDYRIFAPPSNLDMSSVPTGASGDYVPKKVATAVRKSTIMGDVVDHYQRLTPGKLGITFCTDVESATDTAARFNAAGVPARVVSAKTPDLERASILREFKQRKILMLVNVDLFGEGFDLPALEVVIMARPTQSYGLYVQIFGRVLRLMEGKAFGIIIDHVGNVRRHGLPDAGRTWSLDRREKRAGAGPTDAIPVRTCIKCLAMYERVLLLCPYCSEAPVPAGRSTPEQVDGDLTELTPDVLAKMRGDVEKIDGAFTPNPYQPLIGQMASRKHHTVKQEAQRLLRKQIALWAGVQRSLGRADRESYRRFYHKFHVDVLTAQGLGTKEAEALTAQISGEINESHVGELVS